MTSSTTPPRLGTTAGHRWLVPLLAMGCASPQPPPLPPLTTEQQTLAARLEAHVTTLATEIGGRDIAHMAALDAAATYIETAWTAQGLAVRSQYFDVDGARVRNLEVEIPGTASPSQIVVVGAHYDTAYGNPGANDNGSGVAAMLELSRAFAGTPRGRTLRFVAFVNEEPPYFQEDSMGSVVYAKRSAARGEDIVGMLSLETIGYYTNEPDSQDYPKIVAALYPDRGNFVTFVSNTRSRRFVKEVVRSFESHTTFPSESIAAIDAIPGIGWSDHWSFYEEGYPSVMITDTAPNRYPHYHTRHDTPDKLTYPDMARVVDALHGVVGDLVR